MANSSVALDLGTTTTRLYVTDRFVSERLPSVAAINTHTKQLLAIGEDAERMLGRTPAGVRAARPLLGGVVADFDLAVLMLHEIFVKHRLLGVFRRPDVTVSVPFGVTEVEKRAVEDVVRDAGAGSVRLIPKGLAAAYGAGLKVSGAQGSMIVDIGGGTTETSILTYGGIVSARTGRVAGDEFDHAIISHLRAAYGIIIGESSAKLLKHQLGTAHPGLDRGSMSISGRSVQSGLATTAEISSLDICEALRKPIARILLQIRATLEAVPPELSADISSDGLVLCGGSAALPGLAKAIANGTRLRVSLAKAKEDCVIKGLQSIIGSHVPDDKVEWRT